MNTDCCCTARNMRKYIAISIIPPLVTWVIWITIHDGSSDPWRDINSFFVRHRTTTFFLIGQLYTFKHKCYGIISFNCMCLSTIIIRGDLSVPWGCSSLTIKRWMAVRQASSLLSLLSTNLRISFPNCLNFAAFRLLAPVTSYLFVVFES